jgi:hypothetical protein
MRSTVSHGKSKIGLTVVTYRTGIPIRTKNKYLEPVRKKSEIIFGILDLFIFVLLVF